MKTARVGDETHGALRNVQAIATHPRVQSLSFGLMAFVSAHRGAIPHHHTLHDRASDRCFWQVIERAQRTAVANGAGLPAELRQAWFG